VNRSAPPVQQSAVQRTDQRKPSTADATLAVVEQSLRANNASDARAIKAMLGGDKALMERFITATFKMLAQQDDLLQRATAASIVDAIMTAASMGLEPFTDDGTIVSYGGIAQFRPMYRGYLKRIRNSGKVLDVDTQVVYENDEFELAYGTDPSIRHVPARSVKDEAGKLVQDRGGYRGVYAWALMPSGLRIIEWMEEAEINYIRDTFAQAKKSDSPWNTSWGEMARKTVLRRLAKRLPASAVDVLLSADTAADAAERAERAAIQTDVRVEELRRFMGVQPGPTRDAVGAPADAPALPAGPTEPQPEEPQSEASAQATGTLFNDR
jgi:recombination protein RecT